jgi:polysaccharide export outer membrane protein
MTVLQAISMAGGFTPFAYKNGMALLRTNPVTDAQSKIPIRYDDIVSKDDTKANLLIQSGDTILIP